MRFGCSYSGRIQQDAVIFTLFHCVRQEPRDYMDGQPRDEENQWYKQAYTDEDSPGDD